MSCLLLGSVLFLVRFFAFSTNPGLFISTRLTLKRCYRYIYLHFLYFTQSHTCGIFCHPDKATAVLILYTSHTPRFGRNSRYCRQWAGTTALKTFYLYLYSYHFLFELQEFKTRHGTPTQSATVLYGVHLPFVFTHFTWCFCCLNAPRSVKVLPVYSCSIPCDPIMYSRYRNKKRNRTGKSEWGKGSSYQTLCEWVLWKISREPWNATLAVEYPDPGGFYNTQHCYVK